MVTLTAKPLTTHTERAIVENALIAAIADADVDAFDITELAYLARTCEHGMTWRYCFGPNHYDHHW
jgi:hypothetical protein